jgi:hypothetical protein
MKNIVLKLLKFLRNRVAPLTPAHAVVAMHPSQQRAPHSRP